MNKKQHEKACQVAKESVDYLRWLTSHELGESERKALIDATTLLKHIGKRHGAFANEALF